MSVYKLTTDKYWTIFRFSGCCFVVIWLLFYSSVDFTAFSLISKRPLIVICLVLTWLLSNVIMASYRWKILLSALSINVSYSRLCCLNMIGLLFNVFIPGQVTGDLVKVYYLSVDNKNISRSKILLSTLMDRALGLYGMFIIPIVVFIFKWDFLQTLKINFLIQTVLITFLCLSTFCIFIWIFPAKLNRLSALFFPSKIQKKIEEISLNYHSNFYFILKAVFLSIIIQGFYFICYIQITKELSVSHIDWSIPCLIYPVAILATIVPITPGGVGVGHMVFEKLFELVNIHQGANIFNIVYISQVAMNLIGIIPFVVFKRSLVLPQPEEERGGNIS
jgi:glycosyltransferase 2 family protein